MSALKKNILESESGILVLVNSPGPDPSCSKKSMEACCFRSRSWHVPWFETSTIPPRWTKPVSRSGLQRNSGPPTFPGDLNLLCFLLPRIVSSSFLKALQQWSCPSIHKSLLQWRHVCLDILNIGMSQH